MAVAASDGRAGRQPDPGQPPAVDLLADVGGVLTPRGTLVLEPQFEYTYDTANRFFFNGIEIVDALLIGIIEVNKAQRETLTASLAARYGITSRLEADVRVPFVVRRDRLTRQEVGEADESTDTLQMNGLGDIDFGLHYQLNRGNGGWPFFVANLRAQSNTGKGPYDVDPEDEAPTGSGFWGVEPSLTVIYPSDPAVLFANVGYVYNFASDVDKTFTSGTIRTRVDEVDPATGPGELRHRLCAQREPVAQPRLRAQLDRRHRAGADEPRHRRAHDHLDRRLPGRLAPVRAVARDQRGHRPQRQRRRRRHRRRAGRTDHRAGADRLRPVQLKAPVSRLAGPPRRPQPRPR